MDPGTRYPPAYTEQGLGAAAFNWRNLNALQEDILGFSKAAAGARGDLVRLRLGHRWVTLVCHPDGVQHVLKDNYTNYDKETPGFRSLATYLGDGLLTHAGGPEWLAHRRSAQPAFRRARVEALVELFARRAAEMAQRLALAGRTGPVDLARESDRLTIGVIGEALFSAELTPRATDIGHALAVAFAHAKATMYNPLRWPTWVPTQRNRALQHARHTLREVVSSAIDRADPVAEEAPDLLSMLLEAAAKQDSPETARRWLSDELVTMIQAGYETTSNAIVWTLVNLSEAPEIRRRLQSELASLGGQPPTLDQLGQLPYLEQVVQESMRVDPPTWGIDRRARGEDVIGGFRIPKGSLVYISPYLTHRHPDFWARPDDFDPENFAPAAAAARHPMAYLPFGGGQRVCIGNHFALLELKTAIAVLCQRLDIDVVEPVRRQASVTLRPSGPVLSRVTEIGASTR